MPCIAIGPDDEEEDASPSAVLWTTSCATGSGSVVSENASSISQEHWNLKSSFQRPAEQEEVQDDVSPAVSQFFKKRVVFLEIDGILNTRPDPRMILVDKVLCLQLRRLLDASKAEVVLTTRWRKHHEYIAEILTNFGALPENRRELHRAPWNANPQRRDLEILQFVNAHRDIAAWVALDARDLLRFPSAARMQGHTIQVNPIEGLTGDNVAEALRALGCHPDGSDVDCPVILEASEAGLPGGQPSPSVASGTPACEAVSRGAGSSSGAPFSLDTTEGGLSTLLGLGSAWDGELGGMMKDLLKNMPRPEGAEGGQLSGPLAKKEVQFPKSDSSRAEFEAVLAAAKDKFKEDPTE